MKSVLKMVLLLLLLFSCVYARIDNRTYNHVVDVQVIWLNPKNIKVYIEKSSKSHILENAFKIWDKALRNDMNFVFVSNQEEADICIDYTEKLNGNAVGVTYPKYVKIQGKIYLYKSKILIAKKDSIGFIQSDAKLLKVVLHEIGHAIGIIGHSNSINDIMYPTTASTKNTSPSLRDVDTVNKLYGF
ncbi:MAG: matrixin family metalloprotease [Candidatus Gastranaerophilales bacterium]|nr:matrixin family metalloprotease [Candidatus Gastranaerophilales bacterium]